MFKNSFHGGALAALLAAALGVAGCSTDDAVTGSTERTEVVGGTGTYAQYPYELPYYDQYGYNQHGYHQYNHRGARCVRLSEAGTCAWWITG